MNTMVCSCLRPFSNFSVWQSFSLSISVCFTSCLSLHLPIYLPSLGTSLCFCFTAFLTPTNVSRKHSLWIINNGSPTPPPSLCRYFHYKKVLHIFVRTPHLSSGRHISRGWKLDSLFYIKMGHPTTSFCFMASVTRLGDFWKFLATKLPVKEA